MDVSLTWARSCLSGLVRHQRRLLRRRHGAPDADPDAGGVHAVGGGLLQRLRTLPGRRRQEAEPPRRGQRRRGRQEERREPLRQGWRPLWNSSSWR